VHFFKALSGGMATTIGFGRTKIVRKTMFATLEGKIGG